MELEERLAMSYYKEIADINEDHKIYLVQHQETKKIYVKKILDVYNLDIYKRLNATKIQGIPNIIECWTKDNQLIVIEEYISGTSLEDMLANGSISSNDALNYINDLCQILENLHSLRPPIIHRDIKPSNIIISSYNRALLLDFNAAKSFSSQAKEDTVLLGTKGYAAPEQYGFGSSSPRTDIYSLGVVIKEMLSACPDAPYPLNSIAEKCTKLNPEERYADVNELKDEISEMLGKPKHPAKKAFCRYLPPGYRTRDPLKMVVATVVYAFIFWVSIHLTVKDTYGLDLWIQRIICLFMMLSIVFGSCNYLDIQRLIPLCAHKNWFVRLIGIIILDFALIATLLLILILMKATFLS